MLLDVAKTSSLEFGDCRGIWGKEILMSKRFRIINSKANCVIRMYINELVSMDHPIARIRFTCVTDAHLQYQFGVPTQGFNWISSGSHTLLIWGCDILEELVMAPVYLVYAENTALKVKKTGWWLWCIQSCWTINSFIQLIFFCWHQLSPQDGLICMLLTLMITVKSLE